MIKRVKRYLSFALTVCLTAGLMLMSTAGRALTSDGFPEQGKWQYTVNLGGGDTAVWSDLYRGKMNTMTRDMQNPMTFNQLVLWNDRAGEAGRTLSAKDFDLDRVFGREGVQIVHLSGLIAALSPETSQFCLELARAARKHGARISFDLNHRASFWKGREKELRETFLEIAGLADILVGNEEEFQLSLGMEGPEAGGEGLAGKLDAFRGMIDLAHRRLPRASVFATTLREVLSVERHLWGSVVWEGGNWHVVQPREIQVLDRIGGGDGFVGGLLYAILRGWPGEKWGQFGWACGALATTLLTDYAQPADEEQVWTIWKGNARVQR